MKKYVCDICNNQFRSDNPAVWCPVCGAKEVEEVERIKARKTAEEYIARLNELKPQYEEAYDRYARISAEAEYLMQTLRQNVKRGVCTYEEIPVFEKRQLKTYLTEYREAKKNGGD